MHNIDSYNARFFRDLAILSPLMTSAQRKKLILQRASRMKEEERDNRLLARMEKGAEAARRANPTSTA